MDALSDVLRVVGLTGGVFMDAELTEPWSIAGKIAPELCRPFMVQPEFVVCFHYVLEGGFTLKLEDGQSAEIRAGEVVLLPRNDLHFFGTAPDLPPVNAGDLIQPPAELGVSRIVLGGGGAATKMICGFLGCNAQIQPLISHLPPIMTLELDALPSGAWMSHTFAHAAKTLSDGDPGATTIMAKLSELLFVEAVRRYLSALPPEQTGWLAGLRDPVVGKAISLMHARLNENWTAEALAGAVNMSRSAFADRFTNLIGMPPMRYLLEWRMQAAMQMLRETRRPIAQIAYEVGYESEAAFTRAFRREVGAPPVEWRKQTVAA